MQPAMFKDYLKVMIKAGLPVLVKGKPGIGKTDTVKQACAEIDVPCVVSHPAVSDPTDVKGMPWVFQPKGGDLEAKWLPFGDIKQLVQHKGGMIVNFLDDFGQAPPLVQASYMQYILAGHLGEIDLGGNVVFIAATNRKEDKAAVTGILEPVKSRFAAIVELEVSADDWCDWAIHNDMPPELIAFIRYRPALLEDFKATADIVNSPCPRTVANVGKLIQTDIPQELEYEVIAGAAGEALAGEFTHFLRTYRTLPDPNLALQSPDAVEIPKDPGTLYAFSGALSHKVTKQTMGNLIKICSRLPAEFSVLTVRTATMRDEKLKTTRAFIEWIAEHNEVLT